MTWREDLRRVNFNGKDLVGASFRGVPFFVETEERSGGRRTVTHEFPLRDDPYVEDLGRAARGFRLDGYVIGDDYLMQADALLDVLENQRGPGTLVLPYSGPKIAIAPRYTVRYEKAAGGFASFAIEFAETPVQAPSPSVEVDAAGDIANGADAAAAATATELGELFDGDDLPGFAFASAETALKNAAAAVEEKLAPLVSSTQELASFTSQLDLITARAASLVRAPADALAAFRGTITGLVETALAAPGDVMNGLVDAYAADFGPLVDPITATRARELANQVALIAALRRVIAIEAARMAPLVPYESIDAALAARDQVAAILEEQAAGADDTAYPAIVDLRSQVLRGVPGSNDFARVVDVTRPEPIPSLLLAYQLYGSVELEPDLVARNNVRHPCFVSGDLKALSDG